MGRRLPERRKVAWFYGHNRASQKEVGDKEDKMNWWNRYIERAFVKSFANREEDLREFIAHNFEGIHIHRNPPKQITDRDIDGKVQWQRVRYISGEE